MLNFNKLGKGEIDSFLELKNKIYKNKILFINIFVVLLLAFFFCRFSSYLAQEWRVGKKRDGHLLLDQQWLYRDHPIKGRSLKCLQGNIRDDNDLRFP